MSDNAAMMQSAPAEAQAQGRNTDPKTIFVGMLSSAQNAVIPALAIMFGSGGLGLLVAVPVALAIIAAGTFFSYIGWKRLTYTIGAQDIRVESGVLSRSARSVPYERIQDVSLEQKLLPRLFGLVSVKFETGAGGGEDLSLSFLTEDDGEELRRLVRELRDEEVSQVVGAPADQREAAAEPDAEPLFTMGPGRLFTFGLFEFSLAVFAVLAGLFQYADWIVDFDMLDFDIVEGFIEQGSGQLSAIGTTLQIVGALAGLLGIFVIGSLTGMVRVFMREWGYLLERTPRGFRRRRGLLTRTDVVMPIHRVQGVKINTGFLRYRFGWHGLNFVSLAQDMGASNHVVAPFARMREIEPIVEIAGFHLPDEQTDWHRACPQYLVDSSIGDAFFFLFGAAAAFTATSIFAPEWTAVATGIPLILAGIAAMANALSWTRQRHALDVTQIMAMKGILSPRSQIATRMKLHSVEVSQGPIARIRGYATLHLGLAGGEFSIPGVPVKRAREVRRKVLQTMTATDFSELESAARA